MPAFKAIVPKPVPGQAFAHRNSARTYSHAREQSTPARTGTSNAHPRPAPPRPRKYQL